MKREFNLFAMKSIFPPRIRSNGHVKVQYVSHLGTLDLSRIYLQGELVCHNFLPPTRKLQQLVKQTEAGIVTLRKLIQKQLKFC